MKKYKQPDTNRNQLSLFADRLDDHIAQNSIVRAIDAYVEMIDLAAAGFMEPKPKKSSSKKTNPSAAGQPAYHPKYLLKLYLYGYINSIRSSRKLETECHRNIEVLWLMEHQKPSFMTIASFRQHYGKALIKVNRDFLGICKSLKALELPNLVALDGSFFKANASKKSIITEKKLTAHAKKIQTEIERYYQELDRIDEQEATQETKIQDEDLVAKIKAVQAERKAMLKKNLKAAETKLARRQADLKRLKAQAKEAGKATTQESQTDPDAKLLAKNGQLVVGYNVQMVTDSKQKFIIESEVTTESTDIDLLYPMAAKAQTSLTDLFRLKSSQAATEALDLMLLADKGYYNFTHLAQCEQANINAYVPEVQRDSCSVKANRFSQKDFIYQEDTNTYLCPNDQQLAPSGKPEFKNGQLRQRYRISRRNCNGCSLMSRCYTSGSHSKSLSRSEHQEVVERHRAKMQALDSSFYAQRAGMVEHPFGTLKNRAGWRHFLVRGLEKVRGEWSLMALGYNFTRLLNIVGIETFINYCQLQAQTAA